MGADYSKRLERVKYFFLQSNENDENKRKIINFIDHLIANDLNADISGTERQLKKMAIDHWVRRKNHKWEITDIGEKKVENDQKYGSMPTRKWGIHY